MIQLKQTEQIAWLYKLANEQYKGDINLLLLEMNIQGIENEWNFLNENNSLIKIGAD